MKHLRERLRQSVAVYDMVFWLLVAGCISFALSSYPMMKLRFDMWQHIGNIDRLIFDSNAKITRSNWHATWAFIIRSIGSGDVFANATMVHRGQFLLIGIIIYYAAKQIFDALLPLSAFGSAKNKSKWLSSMALSSLFIWIAVIGTISEHQQAWIMWYSINYQITLPFLLLSLALFVNVAAVEQRFISITLKMIGSISLLILIYLFHAGELAYLVYYLPILLICFCNKNNNKKTLVIIIMLIVAIFIAEKYYKDIRPALVKYLLDGNFSEIHTEIKKQGAYLISGANRYSGNWNELYMLSILLSVPVALLALLKPSFINKRVLLFIILSLFFCFIPNFKYISGLTALISYNEIVNRYYFASFVFLILPLCLYLFSNHFKILHSPILLILFVVVSVTLVFCYSKKVNNNGVYYQNVKSIINSLNQKRVGVETSSAEIESIGQQIRAAQKQHGTQNIIYCSTYDKGHIVKYVYRQENIAFWRDPAYYLFNLDKCLKYVKSENKLAVVIN